MSNESLNEFMSSAINSHEEITVQSHDVIRLTKKTKYTDEIAEKAMNNEVIPFPNFKSFNLVEDKDWEYSDTEYGNSYQLYIHSLRFVNELLIKFEETKEIRYLMKAKKYIDSWIAYAVNNEGGSMVWYDHPTANRVQVILFYLFLSKGLLDNEDSLFGKILEYHSTFLSKDENYRRHNHGLMMDRSLMILGNLLKDEGIFNIGYYRSIDTFWHSFSHQGFHLENSPEYHNMVTRMYKELETFLNKNQKSYGPVINGHLEQAENIKSIFIKPDGQVPAIGDSNRGQFKLNKKIENFVDYTGGLAVIQNKNVYMTFVSGYSNITHKHHDDLSLTLFFKGRDFLVDSGKYSYSKHRIRRYVKSTYAHSGLFINDGNYNLQEENRFSRNVGTVHHFENEDYFIIKGKNETNAKVGLYRHLIFLKKENIIFIIDEVQADTQAEVVHNFNLSEEVETSMINDDVSKWVNCDVEIYLKCHTPGKKLNEIMGSKEKEPLRGVNSTAFNIAAETTQIECITEASADSSESVLFSISECYDDIIIDAFDGRKNLKVRTGENKYNINF
jgi:hypothetical protein